MSKAFNGEERRRRGLKFPLHITYPASSSSFFTSLNLSFQLSFDLCLYLRYRFLICALLFPFSSPPSCLVFFSSPFSIPHFLLTSFLACVVMRNVLKLARPMADRCRYRLINYKSCLSDQLPHRDQTDRKTHMRGG